MSETGIELELELNPPPATAPESTLLYQAVMWLAGMYAAGEWLRGWLG